MDDIWGISGKVVVVVGAGGGGIGTAIARHVGRAGATVVAVDVDADKLRLATDALAADGSEHLGIVADGRDRDAVADVVARAGALGPLHGGVQVAGGMWPPQWAPFASDDPAFDDVMALNFGVTVNATRAIGTRLVEQGEGGAIVHIATVAALNAMPYAGAYAAAKAAVLSLTRTLAVEWGRHDIRVNAVAPGSIATPKSASTRAPGDTDGDDLLVIPMRRRGTADDIAASTLFLLSEQAGYVTGQCLAVDGGTSVRPAVNDADELPVFVHNQELRDRLTGRS
ncbi:SDR family NAD(P)-dependent oxidoreductase [Rhabdothermincola salaria]|uniref:SDR family NAD(P)-dependent oxidoreductase n=1 Tax=Rhabdothermincola salaria TaxID=2903142 RepID=UPI001E2A3B3D|nr:SDR family oxidoreductase [Rhabdothermincola salaria]MCD9624767.1 SDR family oxidoreductase [Rhabdothermincola salaria]